MSKSYKIQTLSDLLNVPSDRLHDCMAELADGILAFKANCEALDINNGIDELTWHDDQKKDQRHIFYCEDGRELRIDLKTDEDK